MKNYITNLTKLNATLDSKLETFSNSHNSTIPHTLPNHHPIINTWLK